MLKLTCLPIAFFKKDFIYLFLERGKGREKEKHQCVVASRAPLTGDPATTQACALTGNPTGDPLVHRPALSPLSHTSQGNPLHFLPPKMWKYL